MNNLFVVLESGGGDGMNLCSVLSYSTGDSFVNGNDTVCKRFATLIKLVHFWSTFICASGTPKFTITILLPDRTYLWWHNPRHNSPICNGLRCYCQLYKPGSLSYLRCQKAPSHDGDPGSFSFCCDSVERSAHTCSWWDFLLYLLAMCASDGHLERLLCGVVSYFFEVSFIEILDWWLRHVSCNFNIIHFCY